MNTHEVAIFVLLHRKLIPTYEEQAWENAERRLRDSYPLVMNLERTSEWCNGLCGVCEEDCDLEHEHNHQGHAPRQHLEMLVSGEVA